jgi:recombinational DNA repair protein (RecF pathway)
MYEIKEVCFIGIIIDFSNFSVVWLLLDLMGEESPQRHLFTYTSFLHVDVLFVNNIMNEYI